MLLAFNLPIVLMLSWSVAAPPDVLAHYGQIFERAVYLKVLGNTFRIALIATAVCVVLGYPLAYWMRSLSPGRQLIALALVVLPFWVSILVRTYAWIVILGNDGVVNRTLQGLGLAAAPVSFLYNQFGVILGTVNILLPFLVLPLFASMLRLDDRLFQAAASLGASDWTVFWRVFFPLTLPSLAAGAILVFILTLGFFITPAILGGGRVPMIANMLDLLINRLPRWELAAAISTMLLILTLVCYAAYRWVARAPRAEAAVAHDLSRSEQPAAVISRRAQHRLRWPPRRAGTRGRPLHAGRARRRRAAVPVPADRGGGADVVLERELAGVPAARPVAALVRVLLRRSQVAARRQGTSALVALASSVARWSSAASPPTAWCAAPFAAARCSRATSSRL